MTVNLPSSVAVLPADARLLEQHRVAHQMAREQMCRLFSIDPKNIGIRVDGPRLANSETMWGASLETR